MVEGGSLIRSAFEKGPIVDDQTVDGHGAGDGHGSAEKIALVLAGGGIRGAYEVGVLSVLAPVLEERGQRPQIFVGTSVGALNAAYLAANACRPLSAVVDGGLEVWRTLRYRDALRPLLSLRSLGRLVRFIATIVGLPVTSVRSLLDTSPLGATLNRLMRFENIARNVADEATPLMTAAVVATSYETGRSVVFHHGGKTPPPNHERGIDFVATELSDVHVRASAAIPIVFPAVEITEPAPVRGWYGDGGTRLNAPLDPAIALGADRVIVIGLNSSDPADDPMASARPDLFDGVASVLTVLADQLTTDVAELTSINEAVDHGVQQDETGKPRRTIPYMFITPTDRLKIGRLASDVYQRRFAGLLGLLRTPNVSILGRVVDAGRNPMHGEVFSYLFFGHEFVEELIALGRHDAERWLAAEHDDWPWQIERPEDERLEASHEDQLAPALEE